MNEVNPNPPRPHFHCSDAYHRANASGTGSAIKLQLHPAHDDVAGSVFATLAPQLTIPSMQGNVQTFATFDWKNGITLKLDRSDLSQILQVLRGMQESIGDGKGLFHSSSQGTASIWFSHQIEKNPGYLLSVSKRYTSGEQRKCYYFFDVGEALALSMALEHAMMYVCLGIPEVIPRFEGNSTTTTVATTTPRNFKAPLKPFVPEPARTACVGDNVDEYRAASGDPF